MRRFAARTLPLLLLAFGLGRFAALGLSLAGLPDAALHHLYEDDGFYFLEIAWNWAHGLGSSFDGLHPTNGYQPLWQWLLVPVAALAPDRAAFAFAFQVLVTLVHAGAALMLFAALRRVASTWAAVVAAWALLFAPGASLLSRGMESGLYALLLGLSFWLWTERARWPAERRVAGHALIGLVLAWTTLARLEAGLLVLLVGAAVALEVRARRERPAALAALVAGASSLLVPYLALNRIAFGALMPVSVVMKSTHGHFRPELLLEWAERLFMDGGLPVLLGLDRVLAPDGAAWRALALGHALALALAAVAALALAARRRRTGAAPFLAYGLCHWLVVGSGSAAQWPVAWHFVPEVVAMAVAAGLALGEGLPALLARLAGGTRRICALLLVPAALALATMHLAEVLRPVSPTRWFLPSNTVEATRFIERELPPDAKLASFDSGYFGWALERPVVNLDGVANSLEYLRDFHLTKRHAEYFEREGITHVVNLIGPTEEGQPHFRWVPRDVLVERRAFRDAPGTPVVLFEVVTPKGDASVAPTGAPPEDVGATLASP